MSPITAGKPTPAGTAGYVRFSDKLTSGLNEVTRTIQENKQTLDSIQEIGIELTNTIATLGETAIKYIKMIDSFLDTVVPLIEALPFKDSKIVKFAQNARGLAQSVLDNTTQAQKVAGNVRNSLTRADVNALKGQTNDLQQLSKSLQGVVAKLK